MLDAGLPKGVRPRYNINPTMDAPVVVMRGGKRTVERMKWGLVAKGAKDTNSVFRYKTYNVPSEKILSKHSWETAIRHHRCLVPANGFYELTGDGNDKRAYYIRFSDMPVFALAGIYSSWEDTSGARHGTYSVVTAGVGRGLVPGSNRVPIIIHPDDEARWLDESIVDATPLYDMMRPYKADMLQITEVSDGIYSTKLDRPDLIAPLR